MDTKRCTKCDKEKNLDSSEFSRNKRRADGFNNWCKECYRTYDRGNYKKNRDRLLGERQVYAKSEHGREVRNEWARNKKRRLRIDAVKKLGGRCSNSNCRWMNEDGTLGCTDPEILQIDHKKGKGCQERKVVSSPSTYYKLVISDGAGKYQLLCANCNWKKRYENGESFRVE